MNEPEVLNPFEENVTRDVATVEVGAVAASSREQAEVQAAMVMAKQFQRDEAGAFAKVTKAFGRPRVAAAARYSFPRGGKTVFGPSADCARELARCWGNLRYGHRIVSIDQDFVHIKGYCHDLETNAYSEAEAKFKRLVQRRVNGTTMWVEPDERDLRELVSKHGAILERNAILKIIPPDVTDSAQDIAVSTVQKEASGKLQKSRDDTIREIVVAFDGLGIKPEMLAQKLGHDLSLISDEEYVELRAIWKSIKDGNSSRAEHFETPTAVASEKARAVSEKLKNRE